jgi:hypothetical protein
MDTNQRRARNGRGRLLVAATAVVLLAALAAVAGSPASADTEVRTEGDARTAFEALAGAGFTISEMENPHDTPNGGPIGGRVSEDPEAVRVYPNAPSSYCASGWHVIALNWWEPNQGDLNALFAYLSAVEVQYKWDGIPLVEERTAIKRMNNFPDPEFADAFTFVTGAFMPPGSLTVGRHTLTTTSIDPLYKRNNATWSVKVTILPC